MRIRRLAAGQVEMHPTLPGLLFRRGTYPHPLDFVAKTSKTRIEKLVCLTTRCRNVSSSNPHYPGDVRRA